jgi:DNA-binding NtrC family response regulator
MTLRILIVDDERPARYAMRKALECEAYAIEEAEDGRAAVEAIRSGSFDLVFLDLAMPALDGKGVLREIGAERIDHSLEIVVVTANDAVQSAVECIQLGAANYINKPYEVEQVRAIARRATERLDLQNRVDSLQQQLDGQQPCGALIGVSRPMRELFAKIQRVAAAPIDVLIQGETGTGKELIAREIHRHSDRADGPFVPVNTAAITETLAESELFGHARGAFTGATDDRQGCFEQADGGTLFLDEIGDMPLPAQTKILRALQERVIQPVGSSRQVTVDVRVITATHQDLQQAIEDGAFRRDLYYRIKGTLLGVPPLRHRREDIAVLADYFLQRDAQIRDAPPQLSRAAIDALLTHNWPGNVRELEQSVTAAVAMTDTGEIGPDDLGIEPTSSTTDEDAFTALADLPLTEAKSQLGESFERWAITRALERHNHNVSAAARQLGIHRQSLQQKMTQLGLKKPD